MIRIRKKAAGVGVLCCLLVLCMPSSGDAFIGLSFDIISFGPLSLGIDVFSLGGGGVLGLIGGALLVGAVVAFFSGGSSHAYSASYSGQTEPVITHVRVTVDPEDHYRGEPLRIKFNDVIQDSRLRLPEGGWLEVMDDGKMVFKNTAFDGYALLHYDRTLSVWDAQGVVHAVLTVNQDRLLVLQEKTERAAQVVAILLGGAK